METDTEVFGTVKCTGIFHAFLKGHARSLAHMSGSPQCSLSKDRFLVLMASIYLKKLIPMHTEGWVNKSVLATCVPSEQKHSKHFWRGCGVRSCKRSPLSGSGTTAGTFVVPPHAGDKTAKGAVQGFWVLPRTGRRKGLFRSPTEPKQQGAGVCESTRQVTSLPLLPPTLHMF